MPSLLLALILALLLLLHPLLGDDRDSTQRLNEGLMQVATVGASVAVKIEPTNDEQRHLLFGRHFDHKKKLFRSQQTRQGCGVW